MGFKEEDFQKIIDYEKSNKVKFFTRDILNHLAGNSIPVQLLEGIFYQIKKNNF